MTLEQVKRETHIDKTLQEVVRRIQLGNWDDPSDFPVMQSFRNVQDELSALDDVILRGTCLVLPEALQEAEINIAHEGHQGLVKTKRVLREKVWFPNIDKIAEKIIKQCVACQATGPEVAPETLRMSELPQRACQEVSADFKGPCGQNNKYIFVVMDEYSRFLVTQVDKCGNNYSDSGRNIQHVRDTRCFKNWQRPAVQQRPVSQVRRVPRISSPTNHSSVAES